MGQDTTVKPGKKIQLNEFDPACNSGFDDKKVAEAETEKHIRALDELGYRLFAENKRSLLLILQGMDTSGKDGTIRRVMDGLNPLFSVATAFKAPSEDELDHDFLWRIHHAVPRRGHIGIFNRSHYEDVLAVRVRQLVPQEVWEPRYDSINTFERLLTSSGMKILKFYLHISKDEQRQRLQQRIEDPKKNWKFRKEDLADRDRWDEYQHAYEDALTRCNTEYAPWHIVPADRKWHRNLIVSRILHATLEEMNPQYPPPEEDIKGIVVK